MKILTIVGARPQFIKAAAVSRVLRNTPELTEILVHTGQHYDNNMSDIFFTELDIPTPDYLLGIGSGKHGAQTGKMLEAIEEVLEKEEPKWVLVYGDTNSTLAGALAAAKLHIPVAHVEAGLRSFNRNMPEEINRVVTDHVSTLLFAPTEAAVKHLQREGVDETAIKYVGDVMYDAALFYGDKAEAKLALLKELGLSAKGYILCTVHRAENTDNPERLKAILGGLSQVAKHVPVVLPLHPRTRQKIEMMGLATSGIQIIEPVGYLEMIVLEKNARLIATDSGGVQKEAFFHGVPCVTLRDETEWVELVERGWNTLVSPKDATSIAATISSRLDSKGQAVTLYGNGTASQTIVDSLLSCLPLLS
jgi:UDP-GlcNAc3NAcA epimerase